MIQLLDLLPGLLLMIAAAVDAEDQSTASLLHLRSCGRVLRSIVEQHAEVAVHGLSKGGRWDFRLRNRSWLAALVYVRRACGAVAVLGGEASTQNSMSSTAATTHEAGDQEAAAGHNNGSTQLPCGEMFIYNTSTDSWTTSKLDANADVASANGQR